MDRWWDEMKVNSGRYFEKSLSECMENFDGEIVFVPFANLVRALAIEG